MDELGVLTGGIGCLPGCGKRYPGIGPGPPAENASAGIATASDDVRMIAANIPNIIELFLTPSISYPDCYLIMR
ncbi:MAG: hypothetical protein KGI33_08055 [Thaumarchaeota archaeon]|nr:hypothetical protein [Nitrososphaerota archaeon]